MENRSASFGITGVGVVVALVALAFRGTPAPPAPLAVVPPATASAQREADVQFADPEGAVAGYDRGRRLIAEYLGGSWHTLTAPRDTALRERLPIRISLVTVPDPYDSHMDWSYDALLEALRRAMGTAGFVPQSFWIPARADSVRVAHNGVIVRHPTHDYHPGVFLFRATNVDAPSLHVMYLIPEVPTSGVHLMAFRAALAERLSILREGAPIFSIDSRERAELSVLGPSFSGSAVSLRALVDGGLVAAGADAARDERPRTARVVSGSATAFRNLRILSDSTAVTVSRRGGGGESIREARIRFAATVNPDEALDDVLRGVVDSLGVAPFQVAVLSEAGTAYGAGRPGSADAPRTRDAACEESRELSQPAECAAPDALAMGRDSGATARVTARYLIVPFPLNIASLRTEFERVPGARDAATNIPTLTDAPRTRLSLEEMTRSRESPALTSALSTPALDLVLEGLINTLNEHDVRVVVIKATDVRDKLMLARELRRGVRDVVVIVYEGHVLLRRPEYADALRGALVLSSYPLALENQFWTTSHRLEAVDSSYVRLDDLLAFPTDAAIGTYNALLSLLDLPSLRVEYDLHNAFARDSTYSLPPVWLSVIGRDGFYPLKATVPDVRWRAYLAPPDSATAPETTALERPHEHSYTHDDVALSLIIIVPALVITALLVMFLLGRERLGKMGVILPASLARPASPTEALFLALFVLSLSATYLPLSVAVDARRIIASVDRYSGGPSWAMWVVLLLIVAVVITGVTLLVYGIQGLLLAPPERGSARRPPPDASPAAGSGSGTGVSGASVAGSPKGAGDERAALPFTAKVGAFLAPMRAPVRVSGSVPAIPVVDDMDDYAEQTTRIEATVPARLGIAIIAAVSVAFIVVSGAYTWHLLSYSFTGGIEATLTTYRALHLTSGVSPLLPLVLLGGGFSIWTWWQLQQARQFNHADHFEAGLRDVARAHDAAAAWRSAYRAIVDARRGLNWMFPSMGILWILLAAGLIASITLRRLLPSLEVIAGTASSSVQWFDAALWLGILSLLVSSSWAIYRLVHTWSGLAQFLDIVAGTPIASAFTRLPLDVVRISNLGFLGVRRDNRYDNRYAGELWTRAQSDAAAAGTADASDPAQQAVARELQRVGTTERGPTSVRRAIDVLRSAWEAARTRPDPVKEAPIELPGLSPLQTRALRSLEEYIACEMVQYAEQYVRNLRRLCFFLFASLLILVTVSALYPYQPHSVVSLAAIVLLAFTVISVFHVMMGMSRNATLSRISRTEPGKVTWDTTFILNMVTFGLVPLLALATSEFPAVRAFLFSWAEPLVRAVART